MRRGWSPLSGARPLRGDKARQGYDRDLSEGTSAVGSRGFEGLITHICSCEHVTPPTPPPPTPNTPKWVQANHPGKVDAKRRISLEASSKPASFDPNKPHDFHRHIIFQRHLYGRDIQLLNSSPVIDRYLEHYIRYAFILHESWEAGRRSAEQLLHTFTSECLSPRPPPKNFRDLLQTSRSSQPRAFFLKMPNTFTPELTSRLLSGFTCGR